MYPALFRFARHPKPANVSEREAKMKPVLAALVMLTPKVKVV